jgi:hypothetical protein
VASFLQMQDTHVTVESDCAETVYVVINAINNSIELRFFMKFIKIR